MKSRKLGFEPNRYYEKLEKLLEKAGSAVNGIQKYTEGTAISVVDVAERYLSDIQIDDVMPGKILDKSFVAPLNHVKLTNEQIDQEVYNTVIRRSGMMAFLKSNTDETYNFQFGVDEDKDSYYSIVSDQLKKNGLSVDIPKNQAVLYGLLGNLRCYNLHLAEVVHNELFIAALDVKSMYLSDDSMGRNEIVGDMFMGIEKYARSRGYARVCTYVEEENNVDFFALFGYDLEFLYHSDNSGKNTLFSLVKELR